MIKKGEYIRAYGIIGKVESINLDNSERNYFEDTGVYIDNPLHRKLEMGRKVIKGLKGSTNIVDLVQYMDLLELEDTPIIPIDRKEPIRLFNPVRCDGFTEYEDIGKCIILNLDYIIPIDQIKIKSILTYEEFNERKYNIN